MNRTAHASAPLFHDPLLGIQHPPTWWPTAVAAEDRASPVLCATSLVPSLTWEAGRVDRADTVGADAKSAAGWATEALITGALRRPAMRLTAAPPTFSAARARCTSPSPIANSSCTSTT